MTLDYIPPLREDEAMNRFRVGFVCALFVWAAGATAQNTPPVRTEPLGNGVAMLVGAGGNVGVSVGADGVLLVDDQFERMTDGIRDAVRELGGGDVRFVLNTHWHGDHTGGNERWANNGAVVVAHENVRVRMSREQYNPLRQRTTPASPVNGHEIDVIHVDPAHTDGDSIVVFRGDDVMHLGDTYFNGLYPYIDTSSGGSVDGMIAAADRALEIATEKTRIIPGHGPLSNRKELAAYRAMLVGVRDAVRDGVRAGKTVDEVVQSRPSSAFDAKWGGGFMKPDDFVRIVYGSLASTKTK
jgi:glyoxylase-like metal-dependent hydrolase (beta-lactamase superfamily II)